MSTKVTITNRGATSVSIDSQKRETIRSVGLDTAGAVSTARQALTVAVYAADTANSTLIGSNVAPAFIQANLALSTAQSAFQSANNVAPQVAPAFNTANLALATSQSAFNLSNTAFGLSNTAVQRAGDRMTGDLSFTSTTGNIAVGAIQFDNGIDLYADANARHAQLNWNNTNLIYVNNIGASIAIGTSGPGLYLTETSANLISNSYIFIQTYYGSNVEITPDESGGGKLVVNAPTVMNYPLSIQDIGVIPFAQTIFNIANTGLSTAQSAFSSANNVAPQVAPAFNTANLALATAQSAFTQANAAPDIANSYAIIVGNSANARANVVGASSNAYANLIGTSANSRANAVGTSSNAYATAVGSAGNTYTLAAFNQANNANITAISAFNKANAGSVGTAIDTQILYNDASAVAGSSSLTFNKTTNTLGVVNVSVSGTATLNAISLAIGSTELNNRIVLANTTGVAILDSFANTRGRSAQYTITANAGSDYHTTQISLLHNDIDAFITEYGTIWSNTSLASFSASFVSGLILLNVVTSVANTTYNVFKIVNR